MCIPNPILLEQENAMTVIAVQFCGSLLLLVLAVRIYTLVQLLC